MSQKLKKSIVVFVILSALSAVSFHLIGCGSGVDFGVTEFTITGAGQ